MNRLIDKNKAKSTLSETSKDDAHIYLMEFKNVRKSRIPKKELHQKAYDSIMTLQMAFFRLFLWMN